MKHVLNLLHTLKYLLRQLQHLPPKIATKKIQRDNHNAFQLQNSAINKKPDLLLPAFIFYSLLFFIGLTLRFLIQGKWLHLPIFPRDSFSIELVLIIAGLTFHLIILKWGVSFIKGMSSLLEELHSLLGGLSKKECIFLAALSALGEEAFFRGALQPLLGPMIATLLFAAAHVPAGKNLILWPVYALCMGVFLALLTEISGDIYSAVLLHFLVNSISLLAINTPADKTAILHGYKLPKPRSK